MAGLLKYFSVKQRKNDGGGKSNCLPDSNGELNKAVDIEPKGGSIT